MEITSPIKHQKLRGFAVSFTECMCIHLILSILVEIAYLLTRKQYFDQILMRSNLCQTCNMGQIEGLVPKQITKKACHWLSNIIG